MCDGINGNLATAMEISFLYSFVICDCDCTFVPFYASPSVILGDDALCIQI
jgi:hypothetical protein